MPEVTQLERALRILQLLSTGARLTVNELYEHFDRKVPKRTIQRDLLMLSGAGFPLVSEKTGRGNENVWYFMREFTSFFPVPIQLEELMAAHLLRRALRAFKGTRVEEDIEALLRKVDQLVPSSLLEVVEEPSRLGRMLDVIEVGAYDYGPYSSMISDSLRAILHRKVCRVSYRASGRKEVWTYEVEPHKLLLCRGRLYLVAYHRVHDDFFLLAFQRMEGLEVLDKDFVPERKFDMASFREGRLGLMSAGPVKVRLRFSPDISHSVRGRLWHPSQRTRELEDGSLEVEMKVGITDELIGWIMSWQDYAEVLEPQRLREELRRRLKRMVRMYEDAPALT